MSRQSSFFLGLAVLALSAAPLHAKSKHRSKPAAPKPVFTEAELAEGSRKALIETGLSEPFVAAHFKPGRVIQDGPAKTYKVMGKSGLIARRAGRAWVEWTFTWDGWTARLRDEVKYVVQDSYPAETQVDHGIKAVLGSARDLQHTLPPETVRGLLKDCLGDYSDETVTYKAVGPSGEARLRLRARNAAGSLGGVDLESGECRLEKAVGES